MLKARLLGCCNWETVTSSDSLLRGPWVTGGPSLSPLLSGHKVSRFALTYTPSIKCYHRFKAVGWPVTDWGPKLTFALCTLIISGTLSQGWQLSNAHKLVPTKKLISYASHCSENLLSKMVVRSCSFWTAHRQRFNPSYFSLQPALASLFDSFFPLLSSISPDIFPLMSLGTMEDFYEVYKN